MSAGYQCLLCRCAYQQGCPDLRTEPRTCFCVLVKMFTYPHVRVSLGIFIYLRIPEAPGPHVHRSDVLMFSPSPPPTPTSLVASQPSVPTAVATVT